MSVEFKLPELGENIEEGDVTRVFVSVGDTIEADQSILEIETGKATLEVPSDVSGTVAEVRVQEGDKAQVGQVILIIEGGEDSSQATPPPAQEPAAPPEADTPEVKEGEPAAAPAAPGGTPSVIEFSIPELGENIGECEVTRVHVAAGDTIEAEQAVIEVETGKATLDIPCPHGGTIQSVSIHEGDKVHVGQAILSIETVVDAAAAPAPPPGKEEAPPPPAPPASSKPATTPPPAATFAPVTISRPAGVPVAAAPSVRKFARELGIDINKITGTGPRSRISIPDVKAFAKQIITGRAAPSGGVAAPPLPDFSTWGTVTREPMSTIRKMTAKHLSGAWNTIPHVTQHDKADITELEKVRKRFASQVEEAGGKLTPTVLLLKVAASALKAFPDFTSSVDMQTEEIIRKDYCHVGIAVDTPKGLLVPVIRDVDKKSITELAIELTEMAQKAREGKISPNDLQGGCFSISNLGGIGGSFFTPIVNYPEVAILGVGRGAMEQVYLDGTFQPRLMLPLSLSYDHRIIDGVQGAKFLRWFADAANEPLMLALEG